MIMNRYFDNAATSFPKPESVAKAVTAYLTETGGSYGRSAHGRAFRATSAVENCRDLLAEKFNFEKPENIVLCANATEGLNLVLRGFDFHGGDVLISPLEHNSVMRPLKLLEEQGLLNIKILPHFCDGLIDVDNIEITDRTELVVVNHMSNVNGLIQPAGDIKAKIGNIPILVDGAQSAAHIDIDLKKDNIDFYAFTGHKCLMGPTGTGGVCISDTDIITPLKFGGTGSNSESLHMPSHSPDKFEAGTPNIAGIFGLEAALKEKVESKYSSEKFTELLDELEKIDRLQIFRSEDRNRQGKLFSLRVRDMIISDTASKLQYEYGIETRSGLHCAPIAHDTLRTSPDGTVRISLSAYHDDRDMDYLYDSIKKLTEK